MLDTREIDIEIARLEYAESSYPNYAKLSNLYIIRDHIDREAKGEGKEKNILPPISYSPAPAADTVRVERTSEFLSAVDGTDQAAAWEVIDDLMDTMRVINERLYNRVLDRLRAI